MDRNVWWCFCFLTCVLLALLLYFIIKQCSDEHFTAPGLTLTVPPSWFPQFTSKTYNKKDWMTKAYLDRYPFYDAKTRKYISYDKSQKLASTNRFWKF
jgi:hypothetical protein